MNFRWPLRAAATLVVLLGLNGGAAFAHGLSRDAVNLSTAGFFRLGVEHMLLGWDHLLFILGIMLIAGSWQSAAKLITLFVVGHSMTLIVATQQGWQFAASVIDFMIGVSVLLVAAIYIMKWDIPFNAIAGGVFVFGLFHGLGLATRLLDLNLPKDGLMAKVLTFNLGVEVGQLLAIAAFVALGMALSKIGGGDALRKYGTLLAGVVAVGGILATVIGAYRVVLPRVGAPTEYVLAADSGCQLEPNITQLDVGTEAAAESFYGPGVKVSNPAVGHSQSDGWLIIRYPVGAAAEDVEAIAAYVNSPDGKGVLAHEGPGEKFEMRTYHEVLACDEWDTKAVNDFAEVWFATL